MAKARCIGPSENVSILMSCGQLRVEHTSPCKIGLGRIEPIFEGAVTLHERTEVTEKMTKGYRRIVHASSRRS